MPNHKTKIIIDGEEIDTLADILPDHPGLKILFVAKTPAPLSVKSGHYFQGTQGCMFWNKLIQYEILRVPSGDFEDDHLLAHNYGITDIVKVPRDFGNEPSNEEYKQGLKRILKLIKNHKPKVLVFVYKKVLDQILKLGFNIRTSQYMDLILTLGTYLVLRYLFLQCLVHPVLLVKQIGR